MRYGLLIASAVAAVVAASAGADVKAGVDAWTRGDFRKAVEEWRGPAIAGDPDAQFNLGQAYKLGRGVPVDPALAESWFRKAALQGHEQAQDNYGLALFQEGRRQEAMPWLEKSAARDERRAELVLGTMLFNGDGGAARDYPRAYALVTRASQQGLPSASETLTQMDGYVTAADREHGTALARQYAARAPLRPGGATVAATPPGEGPGRPSHPLPTPRAGTAARPPAAPVKAVAATSVAPAPTTPKPLAAGAAAGGWKAQLGAFRDRGNAEALWNRVGGKLGAATPSYPDAGGITRLVATGFPSKAAAQSACTRARLTCIVTGP
ncbi:SPOR domain-containing protein [uncultured Sphingomonas sp.]|uniref:SPOR domain-containing protein n=1 Tax=uncultured Sphingomonas sp. TaxID=158754 RepID=UPI0035CBC547